MKTMSVKISMITVAFNSAQTIERTILSVKAQNYENLEYIIIDGGSTDGTQEIVMKYEDIVTTFISEKDFGISDAFNKGILLSNGELVGIINSDDYLLPNALNEVAKVFDGYSDIYMGKIFIEYANGQKIVEVPSKSFPIVPLFRHVAHQGMFVTRNAYQKFGMYDVEVHYPMDLEFLMRAYINGAKFRFINVILAVFCYGKGVTNDDFRKKKKDYIYIVKKNGGNKFQANIYWLSIATINFIKSYLNRILPDLSFRIRYKCYK